LLKKGKIMYFRIFILLSFIYCSGAPKKDCPCPKKETPTAQAKESQTESSREQAEGSAESNLSSYQARLNGLERNCPYTTSPSYLVSSCSKEQVTYNLTDKADEELYYFDLLQSPHPTNRRKAYSYFQKNCNSQAPFVEFLETKLKAQELEEWESKEISSSLEVCKSNLASEKVLDYNQTGFYFHPNQPIGNGDFYFFKQNTSSQTLPVSYSLQAENAEIVSIDDKKVFSYQIPANSTLDARVPALIVGDKEIKLKIIEQTPENVNEFNMSGNLQANRKVFYPYYWTVRKNFPVYYFTSSRDEELLVSIYKKSSNVELLTSQKMEFLSGKESLFLYKSELDLKGYTGEIEVVVEKTQ